GALQRLRQAPRGDQRVEDLLHRSGLEAATALSPRQPGPDVPRPGHADPGTLLEERSRLVGLVEGTRDDEGVRGWLQRLGKPAARGKLGVLGKARADLRELEDGERARVQPAIRIPIHVAIVAPGRAAA